jgi:hypothetical protein
MSWLSIEEFQMLGNWTPERARRELDALAEFGLIVWHPDGDRFRMTGLGRDAAVEVIRREPDEMGAWIDTVEQRTIDMGFSTHEEAAAARALIRRETGLA